MFWSCHVISASMSMLAEPKRKQKFGPDPRNTFWGNDESKFGFRMLEGMGWKKGRGLGAKEDGMTEHIKAEARSNVDVRGVGCSRKVANNWIPHQDDFNSLLSSLNSATNKADDSSKSAKTSVASVSLEQKSKSSRTRVHYHKFTRGKDLSSRSVHELACIFGWQKGQTSETASPTAQSEVNSDEDGSTSSDSKANDNSDDKEDPSHGVKTITSSSSVQEYFAMKMAELKQKRKTASASVNASSVNSSIDSETAEDTNNNSKENLVGLVNSDDSTPVDKQKKKKKKKKQKHEEHEDSFRCEDQQDGVSENVGSVPCETSQEADAVCEDRGQELSKSKKKEKRKKKVVHETALDDSSINESADIQLSEHDMNQEFQKPAKKAKKRKISDIDQCESEAQQTCQTTDQNCTSEDVNGEPEKKKKKKKKKKKQKSAESEEESHNSSILRQENDGKNRRRKSVRFSLGEVEVFTIPNKEEDKLQQQKDEPLESESSKEREESENKSVEKKSSKKRKRQKAQEEEETQKTEKQDLQTEEDDVPKKKKRKSQDEGKEGTQKKKKSKPRKEDKDTNQDEHVEKDSQVECAKNGERSESSLVQSDSSEDDTENVTSKTEAGSSVALFDEKRMRNSQPVSVANEDSIIASFVGSNLSSVKGYGSSM